MTILTALAALTACAGVQSPPLGVAPQTFAVANAGTVASEPDRSPSWISADAKVAPRLLYVSDLGSYTVRVYDFPSLKPAGKLTGFTAPQGLCNGAHGSIWVTNTLTYQIFEFAHGGSTPIARLSDPVGLPVGCAFDATSGNLAVANLDDFSGVGSVVVYRHARGAPSVYGNASQTSNYFAGYDGKGNLYVSGWSATNAYALEVLPHGGNALAPLKIAGGTIHYPGTVAWHGSTLVLGDQKCKNASTSCLYEAAVSGRTARISGTIPLDGTCDVAEAWIGVSEIAGGDNEANCRYGHSIVDIWPYPAGGRPSASATGVRMPAGVTVSTAAAP
jgi:hypothetical protein